MPDKVRADAFTREREMVDRGAALPETAAGITSADASTGEHFVHYEFEDDEHGYYAMLSFPRCEDERLRFLSGWRHAANGLERVTLYELNGTKERPHQLALDPAKAKGFDTYTNVHGPHWWRELQRRGGR